MTDDPVDAADETPPSDDAGGASDAATGETDQAAERPDPREDGLDDESRRWLVRLLVGLGIGIPVLIEGSTFVGLIRQHFGGGEATATPTATPTGRRVGVGDELLPDTPQSETLSDATVTDEDDAWVFEATATVDNTGDVPYEVRLGTLTADDGQTVDGSDSSGKVPAGESATVTATRRLPRGSEPDRLAVSGVTFGESVTQTSETVLLEPIPVRG